MRHLSFSAPSILATGRAAAAASALVVGAVLLASCSSGTSPEDQITQVTEQLVDLVNSGQGSQATGIVCKTMLEQTSGLQDTQPLENPGKIEKIEDIKIDGDKATAKVTVSSADLPDPQSETMSFVNEDGWKFCG